MRKKCTSMRFFELVRTKNLPPGHFSIFFYINFFSHVGNSIKREENMKYWFFFQYLNKFKQNSINIKNYTAHPHDMVHVPAKFRENTSMRFWVTVGKTKRDGQTDRRMGGALQYLRSQACSANRWPILTVRRVHICIHVLNVWLKGV